jgi:hypothetical protein
VGYRRNQRIALDENQPEEDDGPEYDPYRLTFEAMSETEMIMRRALLEGRLRAYFAKPGIGANCKPS